MGVVALQSVRSILDRQIYDRRGTMEPRIKIISANQGAYKAMFVLEAYLRQCGLDAKLLDLLRLRVSQINGCAYCLDMHWKELRAAGGASNGFTDWTRGVNRRITRTANARRWRGRKLSR